MFKHTFHSQLLCFELLIKYIENTLLKYMCLMCNIERGSCSLNMFYFFYNNCISNIDWKALKIWNLLNDNRRST